ncbi:MAG: Eco29kI family restriction endonuclease, partial [Opitutales bacterium]
KHGDKATTRQNKRSPWDTMHPGRAWANQTTANQMARAEIVGKIREHLNKHPVIRDKEELFEHLALR